MSHRRCRCRFQDLRGRLASWVLLAVLGPLLAACGLLAPLPAASDLETRLAAIPDRDLPLTAPVTIRWNEHQIPYIEAADDGDAAFALGLVHAHLRLGQMEIARHIVQGRLSEMGGPIAVDIDRSLRILGFDRAGRAALAALEPEARVWVERFAEGVNHYQDAMATEPHEFAVLGLEREPWTPADVMGIGRLGGTDVNWLVWFGLLSQRDREDWPEIWQEALARGGVSPISFGNGTDAEALGTLLLGTARSGSNSVVVGGDRTATGAAMIASDPHLGVTLPNLWLIAGLRSPSYRVVGMMPAGLPFFALGRNPRIAWGGTNMRAASSDLVDITDLPESALQTERSRIGVRFWFDSDVEIRLSPYGPVISDVPLLADNGGQRLALRWIGHAGSDEITPLLRAARAEDWDSFRAAFAGFGVSAQNMVYADVDGTIGQLMAARLPQRPLEAPADIAVSPEESDRHWATILDASRLPSTTNPPAGFIASANNRPTEAELAVGWFFSPPDRMLRMQELLRGDAVVSVGDLQALQQDVVSPAGIALRDTLRERLEGQVDGPAWQALRRWDGAYATDSAGALALEAFLASLVTPLFEQMGRDEAVAARLLDAGDARWQLRDMVAAMDHADLLPLARTALAAADAALETHGDWGSVHRLRLAHPLANLPVIGGRYDGPDLPVGGSVETLMKTAHALTAEVHAARYGSQARHVSDLSDPDANWFVLLGGQDGWLNSANFLDQLPLWQSGEYVRLPLTPAAVASEFPWLTTLQPGLRTQP